MFKKILLLSVFIINTIGVWGQSMSSHFSGYDTLSLQDLMNIKITVASVTELTAKESPAIVSTISSEDIKAMGANDLMDVLKLIPGFQFGVDVEGVVGLSVRGNWSHEGKVVLLYDGQELNEGLYSTLQFGNHYPVQNIERIEIIRGPGSSMYGGYAAHAVINVVTRTAKANAEYQASVRYDLSEGVNTGKGLSLYGGIKSKSGNSFNIQASQNSTQRSLSKYYDAFGNNYSMENESWIHNSFVNFNGSISGFKLTAIYDDYLINERDEYQEIASGNVPLKFINFWSELKYDWQVSSKLKISPKINYKKQTPWKYTSDDTLNLNSALFDIASERISFNLNSIYTPTSKISISGGANYFTDKSTQKIELNYFYSNNSKTLEYGNFAIYGQALFQVLKTNIIAGCRFNNSSRFASTLVPRIGITKSTDQFHLKALYSKSFRSPSTLNIDLADNIKPEVTDVIEIEGGLRTNENGYLTINAFHIQTKDPIIYFFNEFTQSDSYINASSTGTSGCELDYKYKKRKFTATISLSYYAILENEEMSIFSFNDQENEHIGIAPLKLNALLKYSISSEVSASATLNHLSKREGIDIIDEQYQVLRTKTYQPFTEVNLFAEYSPSHIRGLSLSFGCTNILGQKTYFIQPYNNYHGALPGLGRNFQFKITFQNF
ncbi:MAG TPA: TonB-dependent receptor plug domain-containing protein [Bacteroidia bacterium]|nr:TonB-dependent receptor plug domain-containing protein [Bacteroidia bacterium]HQK96775.1 TonB-dependent receptor plug domain-containing protein [Bacteroidia bacterium]